MTPALFGVLSWPIVFRIPLVGDLAVSPHGLAMGVGFVVGALMMIRRARRHGVEAGDGDGVHLLDDQQVAETVQSLLGWSLLGAIVGARGFHVLAHLEVYADDPVRVLAIQEGGLTFVGGVAGAVAVGWGVARRRGHDPVVLLDTAAPGLAMGLAIGRLGDLAIGDHLGAPTTSAWGWRCAGDFNPVGGPNAMERVAPVPYPSVAVDSGAVEPPVVGCFDVPVVPTALVDGMVALVVTLVLLVVERRWPGRGNVATAWVVAYGVLRFVGDVLRRDRRMLGLTGTQWALAAAVLVVVAWQVRRRAVT